MTLQPLTVARIDTVLTNTVREVLDRRLALAQPGHCLRVSSLAPSIMKRLCAEMYAQGEADVVLLLGPHQTPTAPWEVTATRLIELRNLEERPLLAFVPPAIRTAAEDSFDKSTFQDIPLSDIAQQVCQQLFAALPDDLQRSIPVAVEYIRNLRIVSDAEYMRYLLGVTDNGATLESAGAALYHLHAVPDFALFAHPDRIRQRLDQNLIAVKTLTEGAGSLLGRVHSLKLKPDTVQLSLYQHLNQYTGQDIPIWGEPIACDSSRHSLAFDCWQFEGEDPNRSVLIAVDDMSELPTRDQNTAPGADNPRYLDLNKAKTVKVKWTTDPKPTVAPGLTYFRIEIISTEEVGSGAVAWESKNIAVGAATRAERSKSLKVAEFNQQLDEGLYYFRVRAYSATGDILNSEDPADLRSLRDPENLDGKRTNESEDIWFWKSPEEPPPVEPTRNQSVMSYGEAKTLAYMAALDRGDNPFASPPTLQQDKSGWLIAKSNRRTEDIYNIVFDAQTRFTLTVSARLRQLERDTLSNAHNLGRWRWTVSDFPGAPQTEPVVRGYSHPERVPPAFLSARQAIFTAIQGTNKEERLVAAMDLLTCEQLIIDYALTYLQWLRRAEDQFEEQMVLGSQDQRRSDPLPLDIDIFELRLGEDDRYQSVYLLAPTHPLRLLWLLQRSRLADTWLRQAVASGAPRELLNEPVRRLIRREPPPQNLPPVLRSSRDEFSHQITRFYVEKGILVGDWSLYLREDSADTQMLRTRVERLLSHNSCTSDTERSVAQGLARSLQRYLVQHPYVKTLHINMFNPGDARILVDAILEVESDRRQRLGRNQGLRYAINLFGEGDRLEATGSALEELQNPERQVSEEADAFTQTGGNPLFPKLVYSRNHLDEFLPRQEQFGAHIAILQDLFPHKVELQPSLPGRSSFLHGLIQEQTTCFLQGDDTITWQHQLAPDRCPPLTPDDPIPALLADMLKSIGHLQAANAAGKLVDRVPAVELRLDVSARGLLHAIHAQSDWVLTIDRNLGLEYFDSDAQEDRSLYLLDVRPEYGGMTAPRTMITTRAVDEIRRLVRPRLEQFDLALDEGVEVEFLHVLRSLSGRIALKLLSAPSQVAEAIGLALARLFLEQYELLADAIIIPLDAHSDLFSRAAANTLEQDVSLQRSDLLLVTIDPEQRVLHCNVVEVKFYNDLGSFGAYSALQGRVEQQVTNTINFLRGHYDVTFHPVDRLDRHLKSRELIELLSFYLARAHRYGLINSATAAGLRSFVGGLDAGYALRFTATGLIFDLTGRSVETTEAHADLVFHRIGRDIVERLLGNALRRRVLRLETAQVSDSLLEEPAAAAEQRAQKERTTTFRTDDTYKRVRTYFQYDALAKRVGKDYKQPPEQAPHPAGEREPERRTEQSSQPSVATPEQQDGSALSSATAHIVPAPAEQHAPAPIMAAPATDAAGGEQMNRQPLPTVRVQREDDAAPLPPAYDILVGNDTAAAQQYGILGTANGRRIALDLNTTNTISLFGVQGGGKSYTLGTVVEMATQSLFGLNKLPRPLASVIFHYHENQDYPPEFVSMVDVNSNLDEAAQLRQEFGAEVAKLQDVVLLTSADKLSARRVEFPSLCVEPIYFSSAELSIKDWRFLMGVAGNQMYMKQTNLIMRQLRDQITLPKLREEILASDLNDSQKRILGLRLDIAAQFINDEHRLADQLRPGRLIIVDLRDEYIDKDEALGLFVVMLNIFANAGRESANGEDAAGFNKLIVFDEAHKYMDNPDLTNHIVDVIRQMRHQGVSVLIASQDPPSLPNAIIELSSLLVLHRFNSPQWLKHIQKSVTALGDLTSTQLSALRAGDAFVWSTKSTERNFTQKAIKMRLRPRATRHGGGTRTAV